MNLEIVDKTEVIASTTLGTALLTLVPQGEEIVCELHVNGNPVARKSFARSANPISKALTVGPLLKRGMEMLQATPSRCEDGLPIKVTLVHKGKRYVLEKRLPLGEDQKGQLLRLVQWVQKLNNKSRSTT